MVGAIFLILLFAGMNQAIFSGFERKHQFFSKSLMNKVYWYHVFFILVYYTYATFNPSDSKLYYSRPQNPNMEWFDHFGTSTTFLDFLSYPFINYFSFSYEIMMVLYGYIGFLGFLDSFFGKRSANFFRFNDVCLCGKIS